MSAYNMKSFRKILIANRGEIALRIIHTCRQLGISSVAVYSDADVTAPHVKAADEAIYLAAAPVSESYLDGAKIIAAAQRTNCDALHPGYGFLSENADFAAACAAAGIIFIGPEPDVIRPLGLKNDARKIAADAGLQIVPGYDGSDQSNENLRTEILKLGFPVLIKAAAGGGGKGMRVVQAADEIDAALESARREALKSFGNELLLLEKFIAEARHIEVQILGDAHGNLIHLFERDCSVQRRHQKIIEESPSPALNDELRNKICAAAVKLGKTLNYTNAGTVEFILAPDGEFYFIEVNPRLQVEHPVTEMITGLDLVKLQIEIAEGKPLPLQPEEIKTAGHAIEARLYAEDPDNNFLPATGTLYDWHVADGMNDVRIDAGIEAGMNIGINYDPLLAKVIAHGSTRDAAMRKLSYALRGLSIQGVQTNRDFLLRLLEHDNFLAGKVHTGFIAENQDALIKQENPALDRVAAMAAALYWQKQWQTSDELLTNISPGYRNNPYRNPSLKLQIGQREIVVSWHHRANDIYEVSALGETNQVNIISFAQPDLRLSFDGRQINFRLTEAGDRLYLHSSSGSRTITRLPRHPEIQSATEHGAMTSTMPGQVAKIFVTVGQQVKAGDPLLILEAMKMEQTMRAAIDGLIETIHVKEGAVVGPGARLISIK